MADLRDVLGGSQEAIETSLARLVRTHASLSEVLANLERDLAALARSRAILAEEGLRSSLPAARIRANAALRHEAPCTSRDKAASVGPAPPAALAKDRLAETERRLATGEAPLARLQDLLVAHPPEDAAGRATAAGLLANLERWLVLARRFSSLVLEERAVLDTSRDNRAAVRASWQRVLARSTGSPPVVPI